MQGWLINVINQFGYAGIAFLILLENIFPPIPSELILTFSGFLTTFSNMNIWLASASATIGSMAGAVFLYEIGKVLPQQKISGFVQNHGRLLHLSEADLIKSAGWMKRKGNLAVFLCRFVPVVRSLISIPAGAVRMRLWKFLLYSAAGSIIWNTVLIWLGALAGENWEKIIGYLNTYSYAIGAIAAVLLVAFIVTKRARKGKRSAGTAAKENKNAITQNDERTYSR